MRDDTSQSALAEIALALAMCFFSIAIVALVSMAAPVAANRAAAETPPDAGAAAQPFPTVRLAASEGSAADAAVPEEKALVIHDGESFRGADLEVLYPASVVGEKAVFLAVPPGLGVAEAADLRAKLPAPRVVVTVLDAAWLKALREREQ